MDLFPADSKTIFHVLIKDKAELTPYLVFHCKKFLPVFTGSTFLVYLVQAIAFVYILFDVLGHP